MREHRRELANEIVGEEFDKLVDEEIDAQQASVGGWERKPCGFTSETGGIEPQAAQSDDVAAGRGHGLAAQRLKRCAGLRLPVFVFAKNNPSMSPAIGLRPTQQNDRVHHGATPHTSCGGSGRTAGIGKIRFARTPACQAGAMGDAKPRPSGERRSRTMTRSETPGAERSALAGCIAPSRSRRWRHPADLALTPVTLALSPG